MHEDKLLSADCSDPEPANGTYPRYLTTPEAAEFLRASKSYLDKLRVTGGGPPFLKLSGGKVIYANSDLISWAESRRCRATNQNL